MVAPDRCRRSAAGLDWANAIDGIEGAGRFARFFAPSEFRTGRRSALTACRWPGFQGAGRCLAAAGSAFIAERAFTEPGMEGRMDLDRLCREVRDHAVWMSTQGPAPRSLPAVVPSGFRDPDEVRGLDTGARPERPQAAAGGRSLAGGEGGAAGPG